MANSPSHLASSPAASERPRRRRRQHLPLWRVILSDIVVGALILALYAAFKLLIPAMQQRAASAVPAAVTVTAAPVPVQTPGAQEIIVQTPEQPADVQEAPAPAPEQTAEPAPEPTPEPTPDTRTPWQIKFAEHFTDTPVLTDHSYTSPEVSVNIESYSVEENGWTSVYHVADIYVARPENFMTHTVGGELKYWSSADVMDLDREANAILAISGDFYSYQQSGFIMRNGQIYSSGVNRADICVLYSDGRMETIPGGSYNVEQILADGAVQVWQFGPALLDSEGHAITRFRDLGTVNQANPRSAVGYYEPGHYCFVVVDGRQDGYSHGLLLPGLSAIFEQLGCTCAYNLDGGGSAVMTFNHQRFSRQSNGGGRDLGDILYITEEGFSSNLQEG